MNKIALQIFFHHLVPLREKQNFHDMNFETRIVEKVVFVEKEKENIVHKYIFTDI